MKKLFWTTLATMAFSTPAAFAVNLTFQFAINSSGPDIYACNAGIRHADSTQVCWDSETGNSCIPTSTNSTSCICTGETDGTKGTWNRDVINAKSGDWLDSTTTGSVTSTETQAGNSSSVYTSLFANDDIAYTKRITELSLDLASEVYGTEYFVDVCYRGTQVAQSNNGNNYSLKGKVTVTNLRASETNAPNYQLIANLQSKAITNCYMDKKATTTVDVFPGVSSYNYQVTSGAGYSSLSTSASQVSLLTDTAMTATNGDKTPRFCITRYFFKENSTAPRKWKLQQARAALYTEISDKNGI
jgi:hypothetical protein